LFSSLFLRLPVFAAFCYDCAVTAIPLRVIQHYVSKYSANVEVQLSSSITSVRYQITRPSDFTLSRLRPRVVRCAFSVYACCLANSTFLASTGFMPRCSSINVQTSSHFIIRDALAMSEGKLHLMTLEVVLVINALNSYCYEAGNSVFGDCKIRADTAAGQPVFNSFYITWRSIPCYRFPGHLDNTGIFSLGYQPANTCRKLKKKESRS
jgi:hypothetical protein